MRIQEIKKCTQDIWYNNDWKISTIYEWHKSTDPEISGNIMQEKYKYLYIYLMYIMLYKYLYNDIFVCEEKVKALVTQ